MIMQGNIQLAVILHDGVVGGVDSIYVNDKAARENVLPPFPVFFSFNRPGKSERLYSLYREACLLQDQLWTIL